MIPMIFTEDIKSIYLEVGDSRLSRHCTLPVNM